MAIYIPPFWAGVVVTLLVEVFALIVIAAIGHKGKPETVQYGIIGPDAAGIRYGLYGPAGISSAKAEHIIKSAQSGVKDSAFVLPTGWMAKPL
jgi:uncharacterized protein YjlB